MGKAGLVSLWLGRTPSNELNRYVDSKVRVRGVLSSALPDAPLLLVPSRAFVDVEQEASPDPFAIPARSVADLFSDTKEASEAHRVRVVGTVTYRSGRLFFIEDQSGGIRVRSVDSPTMNVGDTVEVVGFPLAGGPAPSLSQALVRSAGVSRSLEPKPLDLERITSFTQLGRLVRVNANLVAQKTGRYQVLELQEQQRVFTATMAGDEGDLPLIEPGSRVRIEGVCDYEAVYVSVAGRNALEKSSTGPLQIRLRRPSDVVVLRGPPWWTLQRTVALVVSLLAVSAAALLWVHFLRRRLERQQAARLAFSRQILEGQETERQRIAINLHDSLGQNLLVIKNQARLAMQAASDESLRQQRLNEVCEITSQAIEEIRQITHGLRPYQLDRLGLTQAIRATVQRASENSSILFASHVDDIDGVFDKESEIHIYRVVQEAVNNVVKHSAATEAAVVIKRQVALVSLSIRDNGRGFDSGLIHYSQPHDLGYGLTGIAERIRILKGNVTINSRPGQGTSLNLEIPIPALKE
jgi:signal transduction histidine kinase